MHCREHPVPLCDLFHPWNQQYIHGLLVVLLLNLVCHFKAILRIAARPNVCCYVGLVTPLAGDGAARAVV